MKYTEEEKKLIAKKAIKNKNVKEICLEYGISKTTVYRYIEQLSKNNNRKNHLKIYLTDKEYSHLAKNAEKLGYTKNFNHYIRGLLFKKNRVLVNPNKLVDELYLLRAELNKIGSNLNQVANYTNFLFKNNYIEHSHIKKLKEIELSFEDKVFELKNTIDKTIDKTL
ncbi:MAG: hypothetical protein V3V28_00555 [Polaribacter sp.]|uniref:plasmid mobilization protein n=1 Tax=Polaribacter sp. TaxID=1920175 RepID=UPI002F36031B